MSPKQVVRNFWQAMNNNDWVKASEWLSHDFQGYWPQSSELIEGKANFIAINDNYPANGKWQFIINSIVAECNDVVTDVSITDGVQKARAITFHLVEGGKIVKQKEFWPEDYPAPEWRSEWVKLFSKVIS